MTRESNKDIYKKLCEREKSIPIFSRNWYLDAVCGKNNWGVVLVIKGGQVFGALPYFVQKKFGLTILQMPKLTQTLGPWIKYPPGQKYESKLKFEDEIMSKLIAGLPKFSYFKQRFSYQYGNWLPFYWNGFQQTTNYTYVIERTIDLEKIFDQFHNDTKRRIRNDSDKVRVVSSEDLSVFYDVNKKSFEKNKVSIPYSLDFLSKLDNALQENEARKILLAYDEDENLLAGVYLIYDQESVYYLMGGVDVRFSSSSANVILLWHGIQFASQNELAFNFEGSMIKPIEKFFRSFGARQKQVFKISKSNSLLLTLALKFRDR